MNTDSQNLLILYDGPALQQGAMDVRDLAPSLLALGQMFEEANKVINQDQAGIRVRAKAIEKGSFGIELVLTQGLGDQIKGLLGGASLQDVATIVTLLFGSGGSLFGLIRWLRGRKIKNVIQLENGNVSIEIGGSATGNTLIVNSKVLHVYQDLPTRKAAEGFVKPVKEPGIDTIRAKFRGREMVAAEKPDAESFTVPEIERQQIKETQEEAFLSIHTIIFGGENKWRFSDGASIVWVTIRDEEFLKNVDRNDLAFSKNDILRVRMLRTFYQSPVEGLKAEYVILEVLELIKAPRQIPLDI